MAAGNLVFHGDALRDIFSGAVDLDSDTIVAVLITQAASLSAAMAAWSEISPNEASGTGYTAGGQVVAVTIGGTGQAATIDFADAVWDAAGGALTAKWVVYVRRAGGSLVAGDRIIAHADLNNASGTADVTATNAPYTARPSGTQGATATIT